MVRLTGCSERLQLLVGRKTGLCCSCSAAGRGQEVGAGEQVRHTLEKTMEPGGDSLFDSAEPLSLEYEYEGLAPVQATRCDCQKEVQQEEDHCRGCSCSHQPGQGGGAGIGVAAGIVSKTLIAYNSYVSPFAGMFPYCMPAMQP